jgi:hypothetical protein
MKTKLLVIILTFVGTTLFWCLVVFCTFHFFGREMDVSFAGGPNQWGYSAIVTPRNRESNPVKFTVVEMLTNEISAHTPEIVLLEREVPPAGGVVDRCQKETHRSQMIVARESSVRRKKGPTITLHLMAQRFAWAFRSNSESNTLRPCTYVMSWGDRRKDDTVMRMHRRLAPSLLPKLH